ncbi:hypothetical protein GCM10023330_12020 [Litoribaculum gwangyangense]|uniref:Uncharacterized protein n=1 Tax=Litoribaculum gwangyangense TaxID=1130722 RepID=A0ABP9CCE3_9FLAO
MLKKVRIINIICFVIRFFKMFYNGYVYEMLRVCVRGFSEGKSDASKQSNSCLYKESCVFVCEDFPKENQMQANKATHMG